MVASCPCCGGKWDIENIHFEINLRCGDEHDILCGYCKQTVPFVIERNFLEKTVYVKLIGEYLEEITRLESELKVIKTKE